jgi:hypothetical protein
MGGGGRSIYGDDEDNFDGNASAMNLLSFARFILLEDDALSLTQPQPPGFYWQIVRELFGAGGR